MPCLRLRQICLIAPQLEPAVPLLCRLLGLEVGYRDPHLAEWGVENAMLAVGPGFLEVCAPIRDDAPARRFLERHPEGGGYIVIFNSSDLDRRRAHLREQSIRIVTDLGRDGFHTLQLHPADVGACMLEFNTTAGGEDWYGPYYPAGPDWQRRVRSERVSALAAVEIRANAPEQLAARWSSIIGVPLSVTRDGMPCVAVDGGEIRFVATRPGEREGLAAVELFAADAQAVDIVMADAERTGHRSGDNTLRLIGFDFRLVVPPA